MRSLIFILLISYTYFLNGQDSLTLKPSERIKEKLNFTDKMEFFKIIGSSKSKCDGMYFNVAELKVHEGKTIRNIEIEVLDPFGHYDTEDLKRTKLYNIADKLHQTTPDRLVENQLLFGCGDPLDINKLKASQEILFENPIFRDAQIVLKEVEGDENLVDVYVIVQDLWSWSFWGEATDRFVGGSLVFNKFAGHPHQFSGGLKFNFDRENVITPTFKYDYRNIKRSFVDVSAIASHDWRTYQYEFQIKRGFFSSTPQWAGSVKVGWFRDYYRNYDDQSISNEQDYWLARSFPFKKNKKDNLNIVLAGRVIREEFSKQPIRSAEEQDLYNADKFHNTNSYLVGIGLANRNYVREKNLFDFYPYRNLPTGFNAQFIGGVIYQSDLTIRGYIGSSFNHSIMTCAGYFQQELAIGSYLNNGLEQITFNLKSKYFTHRFPLKKWGLRQYIYQGLALGFLRPDSEDVNLGSAGGIKGLKQNYDGNSYYSLNLETEIQSPIKFMGFQARIFIFADLGIQGNKSNVPLGDGRLYHAYGIGTRLNNWKLGIGYLELAVVYYPNLVGLENRSFEFIQGFGNRNVIDINNLYNRNNLSTVNQDF